MYTVCYILTDSEDLLLFNEMMISISSLRYYGYNGTILLVTEQLTYKLLTSKFSVLLKYGVDVKCIDVPERFNQLEKSRFLKTSLRCYLNGDYLYVDTDTIFTSKLPDVISNQEIAMVTDHHYEKLIINTPTYNYALPLAKKLDITLLLGESYFNSGVAWVKDTKKTHKLYELWHKNWIDSCNNGVFQDQLSLNAVNHKLGNMISRLDDIYNVQITDGETIPFRLLGAAIIIHYFHPGENKREYLLTIPDVRNQYFESKFIKNIIKSPKTAFIDGKIITAKAFTDMTNINRTLQYKVLRNLYTHKTIFNINEFILRKLYAVYRLFVKVLGDSCKN